MRKIVLALATVILLACVGFVLYAESSKRHVQDDIQLAAWEELAEQGDTAALHRLIEFYDEKSTVCVEVEEEVECDEDGNVIYENDTAAEEEIDPESEEIYAERLRYWLDKGIAANDPVAYAVKGSRLYYEDENAAIGYLSKAADAGNSRAALFCGSACMNQGKEDEAFKYLTLAYRLGEPSAGWHLARCYSSGFGTEPDREKAIEVMRHAALLDYPEAVSEMRRIEPGNKIWQNKYDSLEIDFPDFPVIPH